MGAANGATLNLTRTVQHVLSEGGVLGFYRGFRVGVLRAVPMSALSFGTYELVRAWLAVQSGTMSSTASDDDETQSLEVT